MTMRLDLRTRHDPQKPTGCGDCLISPTPFGCADCETWFQFAWQLLAHDCEARR